MPAEKTLAYILSTRDYRDTSLMATFYTKEHGKVKAVIKGGRDGRARLGSTLEPFSLNEIMIYKRRKGDLHLVTQVELEERFNKLRIDLEKLGYASYFMELVDQMTDSAPHAKVFQLMGEVLSFMAEDHSLKRTARIFEIKLMDALGFMIELNQCIRCSSKDLDSVYFAFQSGGVVCQSCRTLEAPLIMVSKGCLSFLEHARKKTFSELGLIKVSQEVGEKLEQMMGRFLEQHLSYRPKSLTFLDKINPKRQPIYT